MQSQLKVIHLTWNTVYHIILELCVYVRRYQRDRTRAPKRDPHKEIDHKNIILMDQRNSIHTYIFHWMSSCFTIIETPSLSHNNAEEDDNDPDNDTNQSIDIDNDAGEEDEKELENKTHLWPNGPKPMSQCNVEQIVFLLKDEILDQEMKLRPHKDEIIKYIKDHAFDGNKLSQTKRTQF
eukprot:787396_1